MKLNHSLLLLFTVLLGACTSTKSISDFSVVSKQSLELYKSIPYNFSQNCKEYCIQEKIRDLNFNADDCDCAAAFTADSVTLLVFTQLDEYLTGLAALSGKEINYNTSALSTALAEGNYGPVHISKDEADAFSKLTAVMLNALVGKQRKKKLKQYVAAANEPFQKLIQLLDFNVSKNLITLLNSEKLLFRSNYFSIIRDTGSSAYEKRKAMEDYYEQLARFEQHQRTIHTYSNALLKIRQGHQQLKDHISEIGDEELKQMLANSAEDIKALITQFKVLIK